MAKRFLKQGIQQELALLKPAARQPLDIKKELRTQAAQQLLRLRLIAFKKQRRHHSFGPGFIAKIILAKCLLNRGLKAGLEYPEFAHQLPPRHLFELLFSEVLCAKPARVRREKL